MSLDKAEEKKTNGVITIEATIVLPVIIMMVFAILSVGTMYAAYDAVQHGLHEAVSTASMVYYPQSLLEKEDKDLYNKVMASVGVVSKVLDLGDMSFSFDMLMQAYDTFEEISLAMYGDNGAIDSLVSAGVDMEMEIIVEFLVDSYVSDAELENLGIEGGWASVDINFSTEGGILKANALYTVFPVVPFWKIRYDMSGQTACKLWGFAGVD